MHTIYLIGATGKASMQEVEDMLGKHTGEPVTIAPLDPGEFYDVAVSGGGDPAYLAFIRDQLRMNEVGEIRDADAVFDLTAFEAASGHAPQFWSDYLVPEILAAKAA